MTNTTRPPKELIRAYMEHRTHAPVDPPPSAEDIRRELGWHLIPANRQPDAGDQD
jgi:hypothetical protein